MIFNFILFTCAAIAFYSAITFYPDDFMKRLCAVQYEKRMKSSMKRVGYSVALLLWLSYRLWG